MLCCTEFKNWDYKYRIRRKKENQFQLQWTGFISSHFLLLLYTSLAPMTLEIYICSHGRRIGPGIEGDEYFRNNGQIVQKLHHHFFLCSCRGFAFPSWTSCTEMYLICIREISANISQYLQLLSSFRVNRKKALCSRPWKNVTRASNTALDYLPLYVLG